MRTDRPTVVVTLPARSIAECGPQLDEARDAGADVAEVRIDRFPPPERALSGRILPAPLPVLATLRSKREGGWGPDAGPERSHVLHEIVSAGFELVDLEPSTDAALLSSLLSNGARCRFVLSSHLPEGTDAAQFDRWLRPSAPPVAFTKIILPASLAELFRVIIPRIPRAGASPFVVHTTGPSGPLLRAWAGRYGMSAVYAAPSEDPERPSVEPSQIPVDRLLRYWSHGAPGPLFAVIGHPIAHSRSPRIHSEWMRADQHAGLYVALEVLSDQELADSLGPLAEGGLKGLNVTHPYKVRALELSTRVSPGAKECGSANTLTLDHDEIRAENTDLVALARRMTELRSAGSWDGGPVLVIGSGGAARAALAAARGVGARSEILARNDGRAEQLAEMFQGDRVDPAAPHPVSLIVHTTPSGHTGAAPLPWDLAGWIDPSTYVLDLVYSGSDPWLRLMAQAQGARYEDGYRILVYQAAASYELWWGHVPDPRTTGRLLAEGGCAA
jgi:shikimate dehydrogenase